MSEPWSQLFVRRDLTATRIGRGETVVSWPAGGIVQRLPDPLAAALLSCRRFDTLAGHVERALSELKLPGSLRAPLAQGLERLAAQGLLMNGRDLAALPPEAPAAIDTLAFLTRDRADAFARCLDSHLDHAARFGRHPAISVMDASTDPEQRTRTRAAALAAGERRGLPVRYADRDARAAFAERLARAAGLPPDLLRFALGDPHGCGMDAGANRNALLLAHPGRLLLTSDDDVLCEPHRSPAADPKLRLTADNDPTAVTLFTDLATARAECPPSPADLFAAHEALLGRGLGALLAARDPEQTAIDPLAPSLLRALAGGGARVAVTSSGILGDCGARFPSFYLWRPEVRAQLAALEPEAYAARVLSRQIQRLAPGPTVTSGAFFMSTHVAYDQRAALPPFSPTLRGQDLLFGRLLKTCWEDQLIGHVPAAVLHVPADPRTAAPDRLWPADRTPAWGHILDACLRKLDPLADAAAPGEARLRLIGRGLRELAAGEPPELDRLVRSASADSAGARLRVWSELLSLAPAPPTRWWVDLERQYQETVPLLSPQVEAAAAELVERRGLPEAKRLTRVLLADFGQLLDAWPAILDAARALDRQDRGLFAPESSPA
jgi:hypothetical protein